MSESLSLESLGFTKAELQERVIDRICASLLSHTSVDDEGEGHHMESTFAREMRDAVRERINLAVNAIADKHVLPQVTDLLEKVCLRETNRWGEKTGEKPVPFIEYIVQRAEHYLTEEVNYEGKGKGEDRFSGSGWSASQTRVAHLVHKHLHHSIEKAMHTALSNANEGIIKGLHDTVVIKLQEVANKLRVEVKSK